MSPPAMARYFRLAAAGFFVLLTVALLGLWVRSYYWVDYVSDFGNGSYEIGYGSIRGVIQRDVYGHRSLRWYTDWTVVSRPLDSRPSASRWQYGILRGLGFHFSSDARFVQFKLPLWFLAASSLGLAAPRLQAHLAILASHAADRHDLIGGGAGDGRVLELARVATNERPSHSIAVTKAGLAIPY
jgi:hypothetical protein